MYYLKVFVEDDVVKTQIVERANDEFSYYFFCDCLDAIAFHFCAVNHVIILNDDEALYDLEKCIITVSSKGEYFKPKAVLGNFLIGKYTGNIEEYDTGFESVDELLDAIEDLEFRLSGYIREISPFIE